ncbi:MAG: class I SAM-dependent methyltransferase [Alphaproteobacteria bacterium]|nr:class I SAM-dependent methyltransferase [Alphaproteobacteria bacterium]
MFHPDGPTLFELAHQALSSTRRGYDLLAEKFDFTPFRTPDAILDAVAAHLAGSSGDGLDVCCGTGAGAAMLREVLDGRVVGVDWSEGMLEVARRNVPDVTFEQGDAMALPYRESFDVAVSFGAFGHFRVGEQPLLLAGIHRALRPGGRFVFVTSEHPGPFNRTAFVYRVFNWVMKVRNRLLQPPFVMYYLNFLLPEAQQRLEAAGFEVEVRPLSADGPFSRARLVIATKR